MKAQLFTVLIAACSMVAGGIAAPEAMVSTPPPASDDDEFFHLLTPEQLTELVGPLALHPDPLVALILPASTYPADIVLAQRYFDTHGDPARIDEQAWDASVRSLARYPEIISWLDENLAWTVRLGEAFIAQPADVMNAIQERRSQAYAAGTLTSSNQFTIVEHKGYISIIPAQAQVIYVPYYEPAVVYVPVERHRPVSYFRYSIGFHTGPWLAYDCDWYGRQIWYWDWMRYPKYRHDWRHPKSPDQPDDREHPERRPWRPKPNSWLSREVNDRSGASTSIASDARREARDAAGRDKMIRADSATRNITGNSVPKSSFSQTASEDARRILRDFETKSRKQQRTYSRSRSVFTQPYSTGSNRSAPPTVRTPTVRTPPPSSYSKSNTRSFSTSGSSSSGRSSVSSSSSSSSSSRSYSRSSGASSNRSFSGSNSGSSSSSVGTSSSGHSRSRSSREAHER